LFRSFRASDPLPAYLGRRCVRLPADFALPQAGLLWPFGPEIKLRSPKIPDEPYFDPSRTCIVALRQLCNDGLRVCFHLME
jgi:hypothetical protein